MQDNNVDELLVEVCTAAEHCWHCCQQVESFCNV